MMKIYKISQDVNKDYDTYDSAVVYANNEEEAKNIHPNGNFLLDGLNKYDLEEIMVLILPKSYDDTFKKEHKYPYLNSSENFTWVDSLKNIKVEYIGENPNVTEKGVILASFHGG